MKWFKRKKRMKFDNEGIQTLNSKETRIESKRRNKEIKIKSLEKWFCIAAVFLTAIGILWMAYEAHQAQDISRPALKAYERRVASYEVQLAEYKDIIIMQRNEYLDKFHAAFLWRIHGHHVNGTLYLSYEDFGPKENETNKTN